MRTMKAPSEETRNAADQREEKRAAEKAAAVKEAATQLLKTINQEIDLKWKSSALSSWSTTDRKIKMRLFKDGSYIPNETVCSQLELIILREKQESILERIVKGEMISKKEATTIMKYVPAANNEHIGPYCKAIIEGVKAKVEKAEERTELSVVSTLTTIARLEGDRLEKSFTNTVDGAFDGAENALKGVAKKVTGLFFSQKKQDVEKDGSVREALPRIILQ